METGHGIKYRQLHIEDYLQEIPAVLLTVRHSDKESMRCKIGSYGFV